jgi:hypothetical protein
MWKKITEQERKEGTDGPVYNAGRSEGHADVCAELRKIIDPKGKNHWNKDGLLKEVARLYGAYVPPPYLGVGRTGDCDPLVARDGNGVPVRWVCPTCYATFTSLEQAVSCHGCQKP